MKASTIVRFALSAMVLFSGGRGWAKGQAVDGYCKELGSGDAKNKVDSRYKKADLSALSDWGGSLSKGLKTMKLKADAGYSNGEELLQTCCTPDFDPDLISKTRCPKDSMSWVKADKASCNAPRKSSTEGSSANVLWLCIEKSKIDIVPTPTPTHEEVVDLNLITGCRRVTRDDAEAAKVDGATTDAPKAAKVEGATTDAPKASLLDDPSGIPAEQRFGVKQFTLPCSKSSDNSNPGNSREVCAVTAACDFKLGGNSTIGFYDFVFEPPYSVGPDRKNVQANCSAEVVKNYLSSLPLAKDNKNWESKNAQSATPDGGPDKSSGTKSDSVEPEKPQ